MGAQVKTRMTWMDSLRGTAIGLVILWHSAAILLLYDLDVPSWLITVNEFFSPYRMPTLMFLSGMLLPASLRKPTSVYLVGKLRFVAYPLVIWTVIHFFLYRPDTTLLSLQFWTTSYLWFLVYILIYYLVSPLVRWMPTWITIVAPLLVSPLVNDQSRRRFFFLAAFFFLGKLVAEYRPAFDRMVASRWSWVAAPVAVGFGLYSAVALPDRYLAAMAVFSVAGIVTLVKVAQAVAAAGGTGRFTAPLEFVGRNSLVYYVTHFPTILIVVLVGVMQLHLSVGVAIVVGFLAALVVGTIAAHLSQRTVLRWLFVAPARGDLARLLGRRSAGTGNTVTARG